MMGSQDQCFQFPSAAQPQGLLSCTFGTSGEFYLKPLSITLLSYSIEKLYKNANITLEGKHVKLLLST